MEFYIFQESITVFRLSHSCNQRIIEVSARHSRDMEKNTLLTLNMKLFKTLFNLHMYVKFCLPDGINDQGFSKIVYQTEVNVLSLVKRPEDESILVSSIIGNILNSLNFEFIFPLKPGPYKLVNFTWPVVGFFRWKTRFKTEFVFRVTLTKNSRKRSLLCNANFTGRTYFV